tara:strand:+ start:35751 stop:37283 length:1533 start_codon:yes stop_codon:yes gene_type:complete
MFENDKSFSSKDKLLQKVKEISNVLNKQGFLSHNISLLQENDSTYNGVILLNSEMSELTLNFSTTEKLPPFIEGKKITIPFRQLEKTLHSIYNYYENTGASFTEIKLEEITTRNKKITAKVNIHKSQSRNIDKVVVKGYPYFPKKYIKHHLKIKPTTVYNQETLEQTSNSLQTLEFISEIRKPEVLFTRDSTHLYIYVSKKSANRFDGLVGFSNSAETGRLKFNGYLDIELNNSFNKGGKLAVFWSNNGNLQEEFRFKVATPYILNTPITPEVNFEIYKQDSTFITVDFDLNLRYLINKKNTIGGTLKTKSSTDLLKRSQTPLVSSYKTNLYGLTYQFHQTNRTNPIFTLRAAINYGNKTSEGIKTPQHSLFLDLSLTEKIGKRSNLYFHNRTETLQSNSILYNELYQIGGANTIRGFYEQSIFCSSYNYTNLEYRLLTDTKSYIYTFSDIGFTRDQTNKTEDRLYSFGIGYAYRTRGGIINLNYAFGKKNKDPFDFNQGIFHVKFVSSF